MDKRETIITELQDAAAYFRSSFDAMYGTVACEKYRSWTDAIEQAIALLKAQEPCEDAVSCEAVINITAETGALETQARIKQLPSVQPVPVPRVMALEEVKRFTYSSPYIIEVNLPQEEPRLMYGLYSHQGVNGCFYFAFTDTRSHFFDADYGKRWRCWTSRPDEKRRAETPWG